MGRVRRGGYIFIWWKGDHPPLHVHVFDNDGKIITRVNLKTMEPMDIPRVTKKIVELIRELQEEGRF
jgi:predicted NBD/HSP70 family sugar kinase